MNELVVGVSQDAGVPGDVEANLELMVRSIDEAADRGIELLVFPEGFLTGYFLPELVPASVPEAQWAIDRLQRLARSRKIGLIFGMIEAVNGQCCNVAVAISRDGKTVARYTKRALFGSWERRCFVGGRNVAVFQVGAFRVGLLICYDVEFPELVRELAVDGVTLVVVPTALMEPYNAIAEHMIAARSLENQIFVAYANRCGVENGLRYVGKSVICGPDGSILAQAGGGERALISARLDVEEIKNAKFEASYLDDLKRLHAADPAGMPGN